MENKSKSYQTSVAHCRTIPICLYFTFQMDDAICATLSWISHATSHTSEKNKTSHWNHITIISAYLRRYPLFDYQIFCPSFMPPFPSPLACHAFAWQPGRGCTSRKAEEQKPTPMMWIASCSIFHIAHKLFCSKNSLMWYCCFLPFCQIKSYSLDIFYAIIVGTNAMQSPAGEWQCRWRLPRRTRQHLPSGQAWNLDVILGDGRYNKSMQCLLVLPDPALPSEVDCQLLQVSPYLA